LDEDAVLREKSADSPCANVVGRDIHIGVVQKSQLAIPKLVRYMLIAVIKETG